MAKQKAVAVNLSTKVEDIIATMREEMPKAEYFYRKKYGGRRKYQKLEEHLLDMALDEEKDQFTDIDYYISPVGNRWITYTQAKYYPKAKYAQAFVYSFIYYETYGSCGAFFPTYTDSQLNNGKTTAKSVIDSVATYTSHFFYQMSERTGIEYRSKELIRKFLSERLERAMSVSEDGEVIVKFKGGHGFGKEISKNPQSVEIRTYLTDEQLNNKQKRKCEFVDILHELHKDGTCIKDIALNTELNMDFTSKETLDDISKRFEAIRKLGLEKEAYLSITLQVRLWDVFTKLLGVDIPNKTFVVMKYTLADCAKSFIRKWAPKYDIYIESIPEFRDDAIDVMYDCARKLKIGGISREMIADTYNSSLEEYDKENERQGDRQIK